MTDKPVALVTGCSTGVGLHTAIRLAKADYTVVATMRDVSKQQALFDEAARAGVELEVRPLDVNHQASIDTAVSSILAAHGRIDVLVNNAGAGFLGSVEQTSDADLRRTMETNFFGVWNLTKAVLPHMRTRGSGRIISVTSVGGLLGQPFNEAYCAAKFAVEGMMEGLAPLARQFGVQICLVEPGPINTEFVASVRASSQDAFAAMEEPYATLAQRYMGASGAVFANYGQTGDDIARMIADLAQAESPDFRTITSEFAMATVASKVVDRTGNSVIKAFADRLKG
jgi:NAD(P)-dependent dehydrogenase (short-subunit alcohol dehydrogenase family)